MKKFTITITSHSTGGTAGKDYRSQLVEIEGAPDADGHVSRGSIRLFWQGGKADDLKNATKVTILDENRGFEFEGELSSTANPPRDVAEGVEFFLVRGG